MFEGAGRVGWVPAVAGAVLGLALGPCGVVPGVFVMGQTSGRIEGCDVAGTTGDGARSIGAGEITRAWVGGVVLLFETETFAEVMDDWSGGVAPDEPGARLLSRWRKRLIRLRIMVDGRQVSSNQSMGPSRSRYIPLKP
jgi:hypothetical protein